MRVSRWSFPAWLVSAILGAACASTPGTNEATSYTARDYFPLAVGNTWAYKAKPSPDGAAPDEVKIISQDADGFFVDNRGGRLVGRSTGVFDGDRFLLEEPLTVGHSWMAIPSPSTVERYEIIEVDASVAVPAGRFDRCVVVQATQEGPTPDGRTVTIIVTWTYAPNVGLIEIVSSAMIDDGKPQEQGRRSLASYSLVDGASR